jgi:outer membrane protein TolC
VRPRRSCKRAGWGWPAPARRSACCSARTPRWRRPPSRRCRRRHRRSPQDSTNRPRTVPTCYLTGSFQTFLQDPASATNPVAGWQAQLALTIPFYDGGLRYGQADERAALLSVAQAQLEGARRQARSDVRAAFEAVRCAEAASRAAREAARLAEEALSLATQAYQAGASTNIEVIDAERRARDAQTTAVIADDTARQARLDLLAATGRFP